VAYIIFQDRFLALWQMLCQPLIIHKILAAEVAGWH